MPSVHTIEESTDEYGAEEHGEWLEASNYRYRTRREMVQLVILVVRLECTDGYETSASVGV